MAPFHETEPWKFGTPPGAALFLLAHPDDEVFYAPLIARFVSEGRPLRVLYLTDGRGRGADPARRIRESRAALARLGVPADAANFVGAEAGLPDGALHRHLPAALAALERAVAAGPAPTGIFTHAWEGGHPDHDATHALAAVLALRLGLAGRCWQAPFYRASDRLPAPAFAVAAPLPENGRVWTVPSGRFGAWRVLGLVRCHASQARSFAGLGPRLVLNAVLRRPLRLQAVDSLRLVERPMTGPLLYEWRNGVTFTEFSEVLGQLLKSAGLHP